MSGDGMLEEIIATPASSTGSLGIWNYSTRFVNHPTDSSKKVKTYVWKVRQGFKEEEPEYERFFPVKLTSNTAVDQLGFYFVPERFFLAALVKQGVIPDFQGRSKLTKVYDHAIIRDAREVTGKNVELKIKSPTAFMNDLYQAQQKLDSYDKQLEEVKTKADAELQKEGKPAGKAIRKSEWKGYYAYKFDAAASEPELAIDQQFVRLKSDDIRLMDTNGILSNLKDSIIFMSKPLIDYWADGGETGKAKFGHLVRRFWVRDENGRARHFKMDKATNSAEEWQKRRKRAMASPFDRGWVRALNPKIDLYLVPISPDFMDQLQEHVKGALKRLGSECLQTIQVLSRDEVSKLDVKLVLVLFTRSWSRS